MMSVDCIQCYDIVSILPILLHPTQHIILVSPEGSVTVEAVNMRLLYDPNESATLRCMASGGPNNTFMWFFNGESIVNEKDTLYVTELDGGEYICQVSNAAGSENASIIIDR